MAISQQHNAASFYIVPGQPVASAENSGTIATLMNNGVVKVSLDSTNAITIDPVSGILEFNGTSRMMKPTIFPDEDRVFNRIAGTSVNNGELTIQKSSRGNIVISSGDTNKIIISAFDPEEPSQLGVAISTNGAIRSTVVDVPAPKPAVSQAPAIDSDFTNAYPA